MRRSIATLSFSLLLAACAAGAPDNDVLDEPADGKADTVARPAGVYSRREATGDQLADLTLLSDHTFIRRAAEEESRTRGRYSFTKSGDTRYIRFYDSDGAFLDRYTYQLNGTVVRLHLSGAWYPMFSTATGDAAWADAVKSDWFDEAFDLDPHAFPRVAVYPNDLPSAARTAFDKLSHQLGANNAPDIFRFDLHGRRGYELRADSLVRLFDAAGKQIASGTGDDMFNFSWQ